MHEFQDLVKIGTAHGRSRPVAMHAAPEAAVAQTPSTTSAARRRTEEQPRMQAEEGKRDWEGMEEVVEKLLHDHNTQ